jgi:putative hemolysin
MTAWHVKGAAAVLLASGALLLGCAGSAGQPREAASAGLANPASVHCEEHGGQVEMTEDPDGGQRGVCVFPDGSRCDEWAFYRGRCAPGREPS